MLAEQRKAASYHEGIQAAHINLPIEEDRKLTLQYMACHQGNDSLIRIKGDYISKLQAKFQAC